MRALALAAPLAMLSVAARAAVTISNDAMRNMSCSGGVCAPTATNAVLNAGDLETLLASGNVEVTTTGSDAEASDIAVKAPLTWSTAAVLALDAHHAISVSRKIAVAGPGGLSLTTDGRRQSLSLGPTGKVTFANLSGSLAVNGTTYTLENTIASLAGAIAANPSGAYALAADYDASQCGTYTTVPIPTPFTGTFEGLGNAISHLSIDDASDTEVGLFAEVDSGGTLRDISVLHASVSISTSDACVAPLVGWNYGNIIDASASGTATARNACAGGLVGKISGSAGTIMLSSSATKTSGGAAGGLVGGTLGGSIGQSFATGNVSATEFAGGLVGQGESSITNCYATGKAQVPKSHEAWVGGFGGELYGAGPSVTSSYSSGHVTGGSGGPNGTRGGFVGATDDTAFGSDYWDTTTSGVRRKGAGNEKGQQGLAGLTNMQLKSGLPEGFDPSIWGENPAINSGLPYLLANPPRS
ncbi:MAG TPA: GLUG motif-containing protein [Rhizomicrobium sp.]|nr:GLUG motif-containing protein [Rhizomicrobium sp.]